MIIYSNIQCWNWDRSRSVKVTPSNICAEDFSAVFAEKVEKIRLKTASAPRPDFSNCNSASRLEGFDLVSVDDIHRLIGSARTCRLDPIPTWIIKKYVDDLAPFIIAMVNSSLSTGYFPIRMKHAIVVPVLKKHNLDVTDLGNYRPVSNLSFISKLLERCVYERITGYLRENGLMPAKQSAYRPGHSTETALLDVLSDACAAADAGQVTLLGLLDLSSAFDTIDHQILFERLQFTYGLSGNALRWMISYITGRTQAIFYNGMMSTTTTVTTGIPQGSVLGPLNFLLYAEEVLEIIEAHGFKVHAYADDLQVYDHADLPYVDTLVLRLSSCVDHVINWMATNRLCINPSKTELIWLGSSRLLGRCPAEPQLIAGEWIKPSFTVRDLGVHLDSDLSMETHVGNVVRTSYFHIRQLRLIRRSLTAEAAEALIRAFVHSRLDYCNGLLSGLTDRLYGRLQSVLRSTARLVLVLPRCSSVSEVMRRDLHWLAFPHRVTYKICVLVFKCQNNLAPEYLRRHCVPTSSVSGRSQLRSASTGMLLVPKTRTKRLASRGFFFSAPAAWNSLPAGLRTETSLGTFKRNLKSHLFKL